MPPSSPAAALLGELDALHRDIVFPGAFEKIQWWMVASYECDVSRRGSDIHVHKTTFWMSPDKDPRGAMTIDFDDSSEAMGAHLTHKALTDACQTEGDLSIVIGFAPNEKQAKKALREHHVKVVDSRSSSTSSGTAMQFLLVVRPVPLVARRGAPARFG